MDQAVVQGIQQAHGILFQDHQHVLALTPGTIMRLAPVSGLGQLLDTVIDSNTALPWRQSSSGTSTQPRERTAKHLAPGSRLRT